MNDTKITTPASSLVNIGQMLMTLIRDICEPEQVLNIDWWHAANETTDINIYASGIGDIGIYSYPLNEEGQQTGEYYELAVFNVSSVGTPPDEVWV